MDVEGGEELELTPLQLSRPNRKSNTCASYFKETYSLGRKYYFAILYISSTQCDQCHLDPMANGNYEKHTCANMAFPSLKLGGLSVHTLPLVFQ